jgi:hypothetical protein
MGISEGIPAVPRNRKLSEFCSKTLPRKRKQLRIPFRGTQIGGTLRITFRILCGRENNRNSVCGTKIEGTLLIPSEPFGGRLPFRPKIGPPGAYIFPMG